jgi:hypothetical protein
MAAFDCSLLSAIFSVWSHDGVFVFNNSLSVDHPKVCSVPIRELRLATGKSQEKLAALKGDALACTGSYIWKASLRSRPRGPLARSAG